MVTSRSRTSVTDRKETPSRQEARPQHQKLGHRLGNSEPLHSSHEATHTRNVALILVQAIIASVILTDYYYMLPHRLALRDPPAWAPPRPPACHGRHRDS